MNMRIPHKWSRSKGKALADTCVFAQRKIMCTSGVRVIALGSLGS